MSMYRKPRRALAAMTALVALIAACGSTPPAGYYLLSSDAVPVQSAAPPAIGIAELKIAEYLQRPEMVVMASSNSVRLERFERWAEPLEDGVRRTLALNLSALLGTDRVRVRPWPRDWEPDWVLRCTVARLDASAGAVELVAHWSLQQAAGGGPVLERSTRLSRARSGGSADSLAGDFSALLLEMGEQIAAAIRDAAPNAPAAVSAVAPPPEPRDP
jgi:uncharacterized lipoprotein YmbA